MNIKTEYGFDLTDFGSQEKFKRVLKENNLSKGARVCESDKDYSGKPIKMCRFEFKNKNIKLITANNPLTGEYMDKSREKQVGYASYIGIEGESEKVIKLAKSIKRNATFIKDESPFRRDFI